MTSGVLELPLMCGGGVCGLFAGSLIDCSDIRVLMERTKQKFCTSRLYSTDKKKEESEIKEGGCNAAIYHRVPGATAPSGHTCANEK